MVASMIIKKIKKKSEKGYIGTKKLMENICIITVYLGAHLSVHTKKYKSFNN